MDDLFTKENLIASAIFTSAFLYIKYMNKPTNVIYEKKDVETPNEPTEIPVQNVKRPYSILKDKTIYFPFTPK